MTENNLNISLDEESGRLFYPLYYCIYDNSLSSSGDLYLRVEDVLTLLSGFKHFESQDINLCLHNIMDHISEKSFIQNLEKCLINLFDVYKNCYSLKSSLDNRLDNRLYNMVALPLKKFLEKLITKIEEFEF
ncbi:hypothetical protein CWI38_0237p0020 [Hamiltosporidium tvaerminnensis]|uniref:Uncharacterized protein n=1 Tax=Hamiltosporidium tvaerminnensis TaxID=1176355 RepID=A0A4Q9M255_9MICR|nr:hypothetical protein CWI38_0237p0020 [Hamiltosporidium tvaerminnensis]